MSAFSGDRFRGLRDGGGHTSASIARAVGVDEADVLAWAAGTTPPDVDALAAVLGVSVGELAPTGRGWTWDYASAVALHAEPLPGDELAAIMRATTRRPSDLPADSA